MTEIKKYFVFDNRRLLKIRVTPLQRKSLEALLDEYDIDIDSEIENFVTILQIFLDDAADQKKWLVQSRAARRAAQRQMNDLKKLRTIFQSINKSREADSIASFKIVTHQKIIASFSSEMFSGLMRTWINEQWKLLMNISAGNIDRDLQQHKPSTKRKELKSWLLDRPWSLAFWIYLKDNFPKANRSTPKFISEFFKIIPLNIRPKDIGEVMNKRSKEEGSTVLPHISPLKIVK